MIFSKGNLNVVRMTKNDNKIPALDNVHFRSDGGTIGTNGTSVIAVSPVEEEVKKHAVFNKEKVKNLNISYTVSAESIREVLKMLPRDTKFGGILELIDFDGERIKIHDGKREKSLEVKKYGREYIPYQEVFKTSFNNKSEVYTAINLKRLISVLESIDEICNDSTQNTIVYIQFTNKGDIIFRAQNRNKQRVIAITQAYDKIEGHIPPMNEWELKIVETEIKAYEGKKINKVKRV